MRVVQLYQKITFINNIDVPFCSGCTVIVAKLHKSQCHFILLTILSENHSYIYIIYIIIDILFCTGDTVMVAKLHKSQCHFILLTMQYKSTINYQLSTINYQLSTINYQLSTINYQLSTINYQLSTINYQLSTINYQLSTINYQLSTINYQLSTNNYQLSTKSTVKKKHGLQMMRAVHRNEESTVVDSASHSLQRTTENVMKVLKGEKL